MNKFIKVFYPAASPIALGSLLSYLYLPSRKGKGATGEAINRFRKRNYEVHSVCSHTNCTLNVLPNFFCGICYDLVLNFYSTSNLFLLTWINLHSPPLNVSMYSFSYDLHLKNLLTLDVTSWLEQFWILESFLYDQIHIFFSIYHYGIFVAGQKKKS